MRTFKLIITTNAVEHLINLKKTLKNNSVNFRIFFKNSKNNNDLVFTFCFSGEEKFTDKKFDYNNFFIFIENIVLKKTLIIYIDFVETKKLIIKVQKSVEKIFTKNNNAIIKIKNFTNNIINPILKKHNGYINVISLKNNILYIEFCGTCKQCLLTNLTLNNFIKKTIKEKFKKVKDIKKIEY